MTDALGRNPMGGFVFIGAEVEDEDTLNLRPALCVFD